jgi:hypothetical protein
MLYIILVYRELGMPYSKQERLYRELEMPTTTTI